MHFAAATLVGESMQQPLKYLRDNLLAGTNLLEQAVAHNVGRFILSSTANLFDRPAKLPIEPDEQVVPGSPYGESKHFMERTLHWFERIYGLRYVCLRYFNAAGGTPERGEDHRPEQHFVPIVLQVALGQREQVTIFGGDYPTRDGTCVRDYVHVLDLAQAHILALDALDGLESRAFNLGSGNGFTNLEVIEAARRITGHPIPHAIGPRRQGDPAVLIASAERARAELGWRPQYDSLDAIVGSAWEWHQRHPRGYEDS
jgi:UDP-glucose 4-epimerase